ncbi:MAG: hypothetical protein JW878_03425 [Methanomicrobia archaeon]|nr:hypothetical protein [Methanomicrobia archaeon]
MGKNFTDVPRVNEGLNINIPMTVHNETTTENYEINERDMTDRRIAGVLKPITGYKAQKVVNSKLTPVMSASSVEEPSNQLMIIILDNITASGEWRIYYPSKYAEYLPFAHELFKNNIESVEKGIEDLLLHDVQDIKITRGDETLIVTFTLKGNFTNNFVTGKFRYTYELNEYAPASVSILKVMIPQNKTLTNINPGPNEIEGNELTYYNYNWIYPLDIRYTEKALAGVTKASIGDEWELPKLPSSANILGLGEERALGLGEIPTNEYSRFAEPDLWVGTGSDPVPGTSPSKTAYQVANDYKPWLYNRTDQCPDAVYYRVVKGYDAYSGFDAYLIQYFAYWNCQVCFPAYHEYDYEPIFIWVENIGDKPYRVAYDHYDITNWHTHEIHRTYLWSGFSDGEYDVPGGTHTNDKRITPTEILHMMVICEVLS